MKSKSLVSVFSMAMMLISIIFPASANQVLAQATDSMPIYQLRDLDPFGIHQVSKLVEFSPQFSFYENFQSMIKSYIKNPVTMGECKTLNAECSINESGKDCCAGLTCVPFNAQSGNGKCQATACTNGATNPPSCTTCPTGQALINGNCTAVCTDPKANNQGQALPCTYDQNEDVLGCMDPTANNYNSQATKDDGSCKFDVLGCMDPTANNYNADATKDDGSCKFDLLGCMDAKATNFNADATKDDGSCKYVTTTTKVTVPLIIPVTGRLDLIAAGIGHTCAITTGMGLKCWGDNDFGQLGNGTYKDSAVPVTVRSIDPRKVTSLVAGSKHTCALLSSGEVMCWGLNFSGQLGDGTNLNRNTPVKVSGLKGKIVSITAGLLNTCAINESNQTMCWGDNSMGQFVNDSTANSNAAVESSIKDIKLLSGAFKELQAITLEGRLEFFSKQPAIPVTGLTLGDLALVKGNRFDDGGCALTISGDVECWGSIKNTAVKGALQTDLLATGQNHGCVQTEEGLVCWGKNSFGQLGDGSQTDSETPVLVKDIKSVLAIAAGAKHTCPIIDAKTIMCWGNNEFGQLGNGSRKDSSIPVLVRK